MRISLAAVSAVLLAASLSSLALNEGALVKQLGGGQ
jgi:hypothetical protein